MEKTMKKMFTVAVVAASMFGLASCGGGSDSVSTKSDFAKVMIASAKDEGVEVEEGCVNDAIDSIPDADFKLIQDNFKGISDGSTDMSTIGISTEGIMALASIFDCQIGS